MKRTAAWCATAVLLAVAFSEAAAQTSPPVRELLKPGVVQAEVLAPKLPADYESIARKFQAAIQENQEWFTEYIATAEEGKPLPYHANMGITEAEYNRFLLLADSVSPMVAATVTLTISATDSVITAVSSELPWLEEITFGADGRAVTTSAGTVDAAEEVHVDGPGGLFGAWDGWSWARAEGDPLQDAEAFEEVLTVGRTRATGVTVISYRARIFENGQLAGRLDQYLRLKASESAAVSMTPPRGS